MNKKAQVGDGPMGIGGNATSSAHPVLYLGIFVFIIPFLSVIVGWNAPSWISIIGIFLILVGAVLSIFKGNSGI